MFETLQGEGILYDPLLQSWHAEVEDGFNLVGAGLNRYLSLTNAGVFKTARRCVDI